MRNAKRRRAAARVSGRRAIHRASHRPTGALAEPLEGRMLLAFYTVTGTADNTDAVTHGGAGTQVSPFQMSSLRGATIAANSNPGSTIILPAGTYQLTIPGDANDRNFVSFDPTKGDLNVNVSGITIQGAGPASTTIQQNTGADRVLTDNGFSALNFTFTLTGVKVTGGRDTTNFQGGAGIFTGGKGGTTNISNCLFVNNVITGPAGLGGGAICNTGGDLNVTNCTFGGTGPSDGNIANTSGGAISYNSTDFVNPMGTGVLTVTGCTFINNTANSAAGGGGAIDIANQNLSAAAANISNSVFVGNKAPTASGGAIVVETATNGVTVMRCTFDGNQAIRGGAISAGNTTTVQFCRIVNNVATSGQGTAIYRVATAITANDNWWGHNSAPSATEIFGGVTATSWLQLRNVPALATLQIAQATALTADLLGRNTGGPIAAANLVGLASFPTPAANVFGNAIKGSLSSIGTQFVNGIATATFTAGPPGGLGKADVTADGQVVTAVMSIIPLPPNAPDLQAGSDSGASSTDNLTNAVNPVFDVTGADASATVELLRDGVMVASRSGPGAITDTNPPAGSRTYTARQVIDGVASPASTSLGITIDRTPPVAPSAPDLQAGSDLGTSGIDNITKLTNPNFDLGGTLETGASLQLLRAGSLRATRTGAGAAQDAGPVPDGTYAYTARQVDLAGNVSVDSTSLSVTIDTVALAPTAPDLQAASDSGASNTDNLANAATLTFDLAGVETGASVQLLRDATGVATRTGNGAITDPGPIAEGPRSYTAVQTDLAGNVSSASSALGVTIDRTAPAAPAAPDLQAASDSGSSSTDNLTNAASPAFDLAGAIEAGASIQLRRGATVVATRSGAGAATDPGPVPEGAQTYTAVQVDAAGNAGPASTGLTVTFDYTAPPVPGPADLQAASDTGTSNTDNVTNDTSPTFDVTSNIDAGAPVELFRGGNLVGTRTGPGAITDTGPVADGTYVYAVRQFDAAGNLRLSLVGLQITIDTAAPSIVGSPEFFFDGPGPMAVRYTFSENVQPSFTAADIVVQNLTTATAVPDANKSISYDDTGSIASLVFPGPIPFGMLPDGNYRNTLAAANVTDVAGNALTAPSTFDFFFLAGDLNRDRSVDFNDLAILAQNYNTAGKTFSKGNINYDPAGNVDFDDLAILGQRYNTSLPAIPGPAAAASPVFAYIPAKLKPAKLRKPFAFDASVPGD
jgi:hypothetical protein